MTSPHKSADGELDLGPDQPWGSDWWGFERALRNGRLHLDLARLWEVFVVTGGVLGTHTVTPRVAMHTATLRDSQGTPRYPQGGEVQFVYHPGATLLDPDTARADPAAYLASVQRLPRPTLLRPGGRVAVGEAVNPRAVVPDGLLDTAQVVVAFGDAAVSFGSQAPDEDGNTVRHRGIVGRRASLDVAGSGLDTLGHLHGWFRDLTPPQTDPADYRFPGPLVAPLPFTGLRELVLIEVTDVVASGVPPIVLANVVISSNDPGGPIALWDRSHPFWSGATAVEDTTVSFGAGLPAGRVRLATTANRAWLACVVDDLAEQRLSLWCEILGAPDLATSFLHSLPAILKVGSPMAADGAVGGPPQGEIAHETTTSAAETVSPPPTTVDAASPFLSAAAAHGLRADDPVVTVWANAAGRVRTAALRRRDDALAHQSGTSPVPSQQAEWAGRLADLAQVRTLLVWQAMLDGGELPSWAAAVASDLAADRAGSTGLQQAERIFSRLGLGGAVAACERTLSAADRASGDLARAESRLHRARALSDEAGLTPDVGRCDLALATLCRELGRSDDADAHEARADEGAGADRPNDRATDEWAPQYLVAGLFRQALDRYRRKRDYWYAMQFDELAPRPAKALAQQMVANHDQDIATALWRLGDLDLAAAAFRAASVVPAVHPHELERAARSRRDFLAVCRELGVPDPGLPGPSVP